MSTTFYYWPIKARGQLSVLLLEVAGLKYEWKQTFDWPGDLKAKTPFGQLPFLVDGDLHIGQSLAIARYIARKGHLQGDNDADFAISEMLIEESNDIFGALLKANSAQADKEAAWTKVLGTEVQAHLTNLDKLLKGDHFGSKLTAGDVAIFSIFNIILDLDPHLFDHFPRLKAFYDRVAAIPAVDRYLKLNIPPYLKRA